MLETWIHLRNIRAFGYHGVTDQERTNGQVFEADVTLRLTVLEVLRTDNLKDTIDYTEISFRVRKILSSEPCDLLDVLANRLIEDILSAYSHVDQVIIRLRKPSISRAFGADNIEVELNKTR